MNKENQAEALRSAIAPLINAFGEAQWQAGRGVPCPSIEDAFEAIIEAAQAHLEAQLSAIGAVGIEAQEQAEWHAGLDEGRAQKSCLVKIQEPAVNQQLTTEQEPVWGQSRFHGQQWMSCAAEHVTMVLADQRYAAEGYEARYLYAAPVLAAQQSFSVSNADGETT